MKGVVIMEVYPKSLADIYKGLLRNLSEKRPAIQLFSYRIATKSSSPGSQSIIERKGGNQDRRYFVEVYFQGNPIMIFQP
jgi:hypothetical protein